MTSRVRKDLNEEFDQNFNKLSQFETFHDDQTIESSINQMSRISFRVQLSNHLSLERAKHQT